MSKSRKPVLDRVLRCGGAYRDDSDRSVRVRIATVVEM